MNIRQLKVDDSKELIELFNITIKDAFKQNNFKISHSEALDKQVRLVEEHFNNPEKSFYLVVEVDNKIVGVIAFGLPEEIHIKTLGFSMNTPLVRSVYILPQYQKKGIGSILFGAIIDELKTRGIASFYLDAGYKNTQSYWIKMLGDPTKVLEKYLINGDDFLLWKSETNY